MVLRHVFLNLGGTDPSSFDSESHVINKHDYPTHRLGLKFWSSRIGFSDTRKVYGWDGRPTFPLFLVPMTVISGKRMVRSDVPRIRRIHSRSELSGDYVETPSQNWQWPGTSTGDSVVHNERGSSESVCRDEYVCLVEVIGVGSRLVVCRLE